MLVIMNPPYGTSNSLVKQIIKKVVPLASSSIVLCPKNTYKDIECWKCVEEIALVDNIFEDAIVMNLTIARLTRNTNNTKSFERLILNEKHVQLLEAVKSYNKTSTTESFSRCSAAMLFKPGAWDVQVGPKKERLLDLLNTQRLFVVTQWTPADGVHVSDSLDWKYNLTGVWNHDEMDSHQKIGRFLIFKDQTHRDNFRDWWYSCLKGQNDKKQRIGLTNMFLDLVDQIEGHTSGEYDKYFPHLDWSKPWTDKEILKEIGLPGEQ